MNEGPMFMQVQFPLLTQIYPTQLYNAVFWAAKHWSVDFPYILVNDYPLFSDLTSLASCTFGGFLDFALMKDLLQVL